LFKRLRIRGSGGIFEFELGGAAFGEGEEVGDQGSFKAVDGVLAYAVVADDIYGAQDVEVMGYGVYGLVEGQGNLANGQRTLLQELHDLVAGGDAEFFEEA
jgi:hypothetical protein